MRFATFPGYEASKRSVARDSGVIRIKGHSSLFDRNRQRNAVSFERTAAQFISVFSFNALKSAAFYAGAYDHTVAPNDVTTTNQPVSAILSPASNNKACSASDSEKYLHQYSDPYIDSNKGNNDK
jgi:hypothetical protein